MAVVTPHFDLPFRLTNAAAVVEQGTAKDVANCVYMICATPIGYRDEAPDFGIDNVTFETPPAMKDRIRDSIRLQEPRANLVFSERDGELQLERIVTIATEVRQSLGD